MLVNETPEMSQIMAAWAPVLYAGIMSCGVAYTLQIVGQKGMNPTVASLILSLESSISVLAGWVILGQRLSSKEVLGNNTETGKEDSCRILTKGGENIRLPIE